MTSQLSEAIKERRILSVFENILSDKSDMYLQEVFILKAVQDSDGQQSVLDIAKLTGYTSTLTGKYIKMLIRKGYISKTRNTEDERFVQLKIADNKADEVEDILDDAEILLAELYENDGKLEEEVQEEQEEEELDAGPELEMK